MNIEKRRATARAYYWAHREKILERQKKWIKEHPEKRREYEANWRRKHPEKAREKSRIHVMRWRANHPELNRERSKIYNETFARRHGVTKRPKGHKVYDVYKYYQENREKILAKARERYRLKKQHAN